MIELSTVVAGLRAELEKASLAAVSSDLIFDLGPIELEVNVVVEQQASAGAKVRFFVFELDADASVSRIATQRVKLVLNPRLASSKLTPYVSGPATDGER